MPRQNDGTYTLPQNNWTNAFPNEVIQSQPKNSTEDDIAEAISDSIDRKGRTKILANLPMSGFKFTGVGDATASDQFASATQVATNALGYCGTAAGDGNTINLTNPMITSLVPGMVVTFTPNLDNTSNAVIININGLDAVALAYADGSFIDIGIIRQGITQQVIYTGDLFVVSNPIQVGQSPAIGNGVVYVSSYGIDVDTGGTEVRPFATLQYADSQLPSSGGVIIVIDSIQQQTYTQVNTNVTIRGLDPALSTIFGSITSTMGNTLALSNVMIAASVSFSGNILYVENVQCYGNSVTFSLSLQPISRCMFINSYGSYFGNNTFPAAVIINGQENSSIYFENCYDFFINHTVGKLYMNNINQCTVQSSAQMPNALLEIYRSNFKFAGFGTGTGSYEAFNKTGDCVWYTDTVTLFKPGTAAVGQKTVLQPNTP